MTRGRGSDAAGGAAAGTGPLVIDGDRAIVLWCRALGNDVVSVAGLGGRGGSGGAVLQALRWFRRLGGSGAAARWGGAVQRRGGPGGAAARVGRGRGEAGGAAGSGGSALLGGYLLAGALCGGPPHVDDDRGDHLGGAAAGAD